MPGDGCYLHLTEITAILGLCDYKFSYHNNAAYHMIIIAVPCMHKVHQNTNKYFYRVVHCTYQIYHYAEKIIIITHFQ